MDRVGKPWSNETLSQGVVHLNVTSSSSRKDLFTASEKSLDCPCLRLLIFRTVFSQRERLEDCLFCSGFVL